MSELLSVYVKEKYNLKEMFETFEDFKNYILRTKLVDIESFLRRNIQSLFDIQEIQHDISLIKNFKKIHSRQSSQDSFQDSSSVRHQSSETSQPYTQQQLRNFIQRIKATTQQTKKINQVMESDKLHKIEKAKQIQRNIINAFSSRIRGSLYNDILQFELVNRELLFEKLRKKDKLIIENYLNTGLSLPITELEIENLQNFPILIRSRTNAPNLITTITNYLKIVEEEYNKRKRTNITLPLVL